MRLILIVLVMLSISCDLFRKPPKEDDDFDRTEEVRAAHRLWLQELHGLQNPETTWPVDDCDAWVWVGKAVAAGATGINLALSEYPGEPGRYGRRPPKDGLWCYQDGVSYGSASSWSADMFKCGMLVYALSRGDVTMLKRHRDYGKDNGWQMGEPSGSDRVWYKPNIRGWLARAIDHLGGGYDNDALIPDVYLGGLIDYKAHLQMCGIWAVGEMEGGLLPSQLERVREHYERSPNTLFYSFMHGRWISGNLDPVASSLVANPTSAGEYVRCGGQPGCQIAEKAWIAALILRAQ